MKIKIWIIIMVALLNYVAYHFEYFRLWFALMGIITLVVYFFENKDVEISGSIKILYGFISVVFGFFLFPYQALYNLFCSGEDD